MTWTSTPYANVLLGFRIPVVNDAELARCRSLVFISKPLLWVSEIGLILSYFEVEAAGQLVCDRSGLGAFSKFRRYEEEWYWLVTGAPRGKFQKSGYEKL